jgi:signal peptidase II
VRTKLILAAVLVGGILVADIVTKRWALDALHHGLTIESAIRGVPLTLAFNQGIAFGLDIPSAGRWILIVASIFVVLMLASMFRTAKHDDWVRLSALSLVAAGAVGNLIDRVRWDRGVVDFIGPIDLGFMHWPIFNVADMAITVGAIFLAYSLWREGSQVKAAEIEAAAASSRATPDTGD